MYKINFETLEYLDQLAKNNNREWFNEHKVRFQRVNENVVCFADKLLNELSKNDHIETSSGKKSVHRIYRDIRFSKDKTPYKTHLSGSFKRATEELRGGYYFHLEPGNSFIAGGFWGPNPKDLLRIRQEISIDASELKEIISDKKFTTTFGSIQGKKLKTAPRGFDKKHSDIELLRFTQFILMKRFEDKEIEKENFYKSASDVFSNMRPFFNYMSSVLTTDLNGISII